MLIHAPFFEIPFIGASLSLVALVTHLFIHTDVYKWLRGRSFDSLFFMNTTLLLWICNSVGNIFVFTKNSVNEIKEYDLIRSKGR